MMRFWLKQQLDQPDCRVFIDSRDIPLGHDWRAAIGQSLKASKCLVCVVSVDYIQSIACQCEFLSFRDREDALGMRRGQLIAPALFYDNENRLTPDILALQYADFTPYSATIEAFWHTTNASIFEAFLKEKFLPSVASKIASAPTYRDDFPVTVFPEHLRPPPRPPYQRPPRTPTHWLPLTPAA